MEKIVASSKRSLRKVRIISRTVFFMFDGIHRVNVEPKFREASTTDTNVKQLGASGARNAARNETLRARIGQSIRPDKTREQAQMVA